MGIDESTDAKPENSMVVDAKSFSSTGLNDIHTASKTDSTTIVNGIDSNKLFKCTDCPKSFTRKYNLYHHQKICQKEEFSTPIRETGKGNENKTPNTGSNFKRSHGKKLSLSSTRKSLTNGHKDTPKTALEKMRKLNKLYLNSISVGPHSPKVKIQPNDNPEKNEKEACALVPEVYIPNDKEGPYEPEQTVKCVCCNGAGD